MEPWMYRALAAWGRYLGSQRYYIEAQQAQAAHEDAPPDAIYRRDGDLGWATIRDLRADGKTALADKLTRDTEEADRPRGVGPYDR